ncbi:MAG: carboxypeptidase regulatory-like domain-containing protein [Candidatus Acidiferrales bacterium]
MRRYVLSLALVAMAGSAMVVLAGPPAGTGTINGKVTYTGTPPKMKPIDMSKEPTCAKEHNPPDLIQTVTTGPGDALEYAVVYISKGGTEETTPPSQSVRFDQKGCMYIPHVQVMEVDQPLIIYNNDPVAHNIHPMPKQNSEWNKSQPPGTPPIDAKWEKAEFIPVKCNIHPWMHGYFVVLKTSHYAVTGQDGSFSLSGLAPGEYTVTAWQEQYGFQSQEVTVGAGETKAANFTYKVTPYLF